MTAESSETTHKIKKSSPMLHRIVINTIINIMTLTKEKKLKYSWHVLQKGEKYIIVLEIILPQMFKMYISELSREVTCSLRAPNQQKVLQYTQYLSITTYSSNMTYLLLSLFLERLQRTESRGFKVKNNDGIWILPPSYCQ